MLQHALFILRNETVGAGAVMGAAPYIEKIPQCKRIGVLQLFTEHIR